MDKILIYDKSQQLFTVEEVCEILRRRLKISEIRLSPEVIASVEGVFSTDAGDAMIRLISSRRMIAVEGNPLAVLEAIIGIRGEMQRSLHVVDEGYSFDISLQDIDTVEGLRAAIKEANS